MADEHTHEHTHGHDHHAHDHEHDDHDHDHDEELDEETRAALEEAQATALKRRALAQIRQYPDVALRMKAREIDAFDEELVQLVERMQILMKDAQGVGLAATQLGMLRRLFIFQEGEDIWRKWHGVRSSLLLATVLSLHSLGGDHPNSLPRVDFTPRPVDNLVETESGQAKHLVGRPHRVRHTLGCPPKRKQFVI